MTAKRRRLPSLFFRLPHEVLERLFTFFQNVEDLINLSICSKEYYEFLKPYVYNCVCLSWEDLTKLEKDELVGIDKLKPFVECLKIEEFDIRKEWSFNYVVLNKQFENLKSLKMKISNSSNFLKYLRDDGLKLDELELINMNQESNLFNIDHLRKIKVKSLKLNGFLIDFEEFDDMITHLELINCYWNYPFELDQFTKLVELTLNYSNEFIISERFRGFLMNPMLSNLEILKIINNNSNLKLYIPAKLIQIISAKIPTLQKVQLSGNVITSPSPKPSPNTHNVRVVVDHQYIHSVLET